MKLISAFGNVFFFLDTNFNLSISHIPSASCLFLFCCLNWTFVQDLSSRASTNNSNSKQPQGRLGTRSLLSRQHLGQGVQAQGGTWPRRSEGWLLSQRCSIGVLQLPWPVCRICCLSCGRKRWLEVRSILWIRILYQWCQIQIRKGKQQDGGLQSQAQIRLSKDELRTDILSDGWQMTDDGWQMTDDRWRIMDDRWQMKDHGWQMMDDSWLTAFDKI